jgi:tetratricopeptide (TPR) repeat protein
MKLPTESLHYLLKIIKSNDPKFTTQAIAASVEDAQLQHETDIAEALIAVKDQKLYPADKVSEVHYLLAKYYLKKDNPEKALEHVAKVQAKNPQYYKAQYLASVAEYVMGKLDASLKRQQDIATELTRKGIQKEILALVQVNIGRVAFQRGKFKDSLESFRNVPKDHPLWMQALTEQAWSQLQYKDSAGAIGNMHSIHSPYFEAVFKPESYVVRAIGYLDICQYADAYKSLGYLEHKYKPWLFKMEAYSKKSSTNQIYQTVATYLQGKSNMNVDGVPYQVIREIAHQRDFLNAQDSINQLIDEQGGYPFVKKLIEKDKTSLMVRRNSTITKIAQIQLKIKKIKNMPTAPRQAEAWRFELAGLEDFLSIYEFKVQTLKEGMTGLDHLTPIAQDRITKAKNEIKDSAGKILKNHFARLIRELRKNMENNELIKYEIFAGSGENIRYQVAGGKAANPKVRENRKPNGMNWDFDGEFWEDEIGNYRSALKNNCQAQGGAQAKKE